MRQFSGYLENVEWGIIIMATRCGSLLVHNPNVLWVTVLSPKKLPGVAHPLFLCYLGLLFLCIYALHLVLDDVLRAILS